MQRFNEFVHYIWVGENEIPDTFLTNFNNTRKLNPHYNFRLWTDENIRNEILLENVAYNNLDIFEKLQLARYTIGHKLGGIVCDFDIIWKVSFDEIYDWFCWPVTMIFPYKNSVCFYDKGKKTTLVDDFFFMTAPGYTKNFLDFCRQRGSINSGPQIGIYSPKNLCEWLLSQENVKYLSHRQLSQDVNSIFGVHSNNRTWKQDALDV